LLTEKALIIIPARYASTRFPGKPLAPIAGVPMVVRVLQRAHRVRNASKVVVATDDRRIADVVREHGGEAVITSKRHSSGTSRAAEVARTLSNFGIVVNLQGDEPLFPIKGVERLIDEMVRDSGIVMATLASRKISDRELRSPDVVKVVCDLEGDALYFSRSPIPRSRDRGSPKQGGLKHIGIYAFRRDFLLKFPCLPRGRLERTESLEQLRALENGYKIRVLAGNYTSIAVDRPADIKRVEKKIQKR